MSESNAIRCYEYVTAPYERVRDTLRADALGVFQRATTAAKARTEKVVASLRVNVGSLEVGTDATIALLDIIEEASAPGMHGPRTRLLIEWRATKVAGLFPVMKAQLSVYPLSAEETQLDFAGDYVPPGGIVGGVVDAIIGRRIAEAMVHQFVEDVAARLRQELAPR
ncbi:MAG TPA: hypothetical protein VLT33_40580 [Labilithrix sp.]|nr:hypothetical protein [Labilithrix sp.]